MFTDTLTLNASAFTGVSLAVDHSLTSVKDGASTRSAPTLALTTPQILDVKHRKVKRGKNVYIQSTIGLTRSEIPPTGFVAGDALLYHSIRLTLDRPTDAVAVPTTAIVKQWGELMSVFGVSISAAGVPTAAVAKFLNTEP